jgi:hypothetical protein
MGVFAITLLVRFLACSLSRAVEMATTMRRLHSSEYYSTLSRSVTI